MEPNNSVARYDARRLGRQRLLHALILVTFVLGIGIIGVAVNMAEHVDAFRSPRTGTYWAGVICVALVLLYLPTHYVTSRRPNHQTSKHMFSFWVFLASFAVVCLFFAALVAVYYVSLIQGTDQNSCIYYNATGGHQKFYKSDQDCQMKCAKKFNGNPRKTCCCCHTNAPSSSHYSGIYVQGIDSCSDLFGIVSQSIYALSAINSSAFIVVLLVSILGCGVCCNCCRASASWTPHTQEVVILTAEPAFYGDKVPLMEGHMVGLDVPPAYSSN